jgi:hypothetical protein
MIPDRFSLVATSSPYRIEIGLKTGKYGALDLSVSGEGTLAEEIFAKLQDWASDIKPKRWLQIWHAYAFFAGMFLYVWCIVAIVAFGQISGPKEGPSIIRQQAREMARQGVTQTNQTRALELLLSIESGYEPTPSPMIRDFPDMRFYIYFAAGLFVLIFACIPPSGALGLWRGKSSIQVQQRWIRFVSVSVPGFIGGSILLPFVLRALGLSS